MTKSKMEEVIALWRRSGPQGEELYGPAVREEVEREIFGSTGGPSRDMPTKDRVLSAINSTIQAKHVEAAQKPWDRTVQTQLNALMGLSEMVNTRSVPPIELQQIMDQLKGMGHVVQPQSLPVPAPAPAPPHIPQMQQMQQQSQRSSFPPGGRSPMPNFPPSSSTPTLPPFAPSIRADYPSLAPRSPIPHASTPLAAPVPGPPATTGATDISNILKGLTGFLSAPRTPDVPPAPLPSQSKIKLDEYEEMILRLNLKLTNLDFNR